MREMRREVCGRIVFSEIESFGSTEAHRGTITIKRDDGDYLKLSVNSYTEFDSLKEGESVCAEYEELAGPDDLTATRIKRISGGEIDGQAVNR
jgi:hypothetical protein